VWQKKIQSVIYTHGYRGNGCPTYGGEKGIIRLTIGAGERDVQL
jgi:hypothetical protein